MATAQLLNSGNLHAGGFLAAEKDGIGDKTLEDVTSRSNWHLTERKCVCSFHLGSSALIDTKAGLAKQGQREGLECLPRCKGLRDWSGQLLCLLDRTQCALVQDLDPHAEVVECGHGVADKTQHFVDRGALRLCVVFENLQSGIDGQWDSDGKTS